MGCLVSESILEHTVGAGKLNGPLVLGHSILCWDMKRYHRVLKVSFPRLPLFRSRVINEVSIDGETYMNRPHYHPLQRDQQYSLSVPAALQGTLLRMMVLSFDLYPTLAHRRFDNHFQIFKPWGKLAADLIKQWFHVYPYSN